MNESSTTTTAVDSEHPLLPSIKIHHPSSPRHHHHSSNSSSTPTPTAGARRKIGVAVDLSDESAYAVHWAVNHYIRPGDAEQQQQEDFDAFTASKAADLAKPLKRRGSDGKLGSVSDYCVHHCVCPVVVVRNPDDKEAEPVVTVKKEGILECDETADDRKVVTFSVQIFELIVDRTDKFSGMLSKVSDPLHGSSHLQVVDNREG
ncbi:hypothetical protein ACFE04_022654 [Oxalis oulophora]